MSFKASHYVSTNAIELAPVPNNLSHLKCFLPRAEMTKMAEMVKMAEMARMAKDLADASKKMTNIESR
jgi:hypothetical protein